LLSKIPKQKDNPFIFPGKDTQSHLVNLDKPWRRIRKAAGLEDVHIHDLRRTLGSRLVQAGHSLKVVKETLRHKDIKTTEIYARIADSQKSNALEEQGDSLQEALLGSIESLLQNE
jgi:integrase